MKNLFLLILFAFSISKIGAQPRTYFLFAHAKKRTVQNCVEKELINNAEVSLTPEEAADYRSKYLAQLRTKYNSANGYESVFVELVPPKKVIIYFEGKKTYDQRRDGWNCTSTFYHCVVQSDLLSAENSITALKAEYKDTEFTNFKRWGTPMIEAEKTDDLEVRWYTGKTGVTAFITNTRKDAALKVTIKSLKSSGINLSLEGDFKKAKLVESFTLVLQPGEKWTQNLADADGFEVETDAAELKQEKQGLINSVKPLMKRFFKDSNGKITPLVDVGTGVRG